MSEHWYQEAVFYELYLRTFNDGNGDGHGDSYSAFALALIIAHELAGKKPVVLGSLVDDSHGGTPGDRFLRRFEQRQREYELEKEILAEADDGRDAEIRAVRDATTFDSSKL